MGRIDLGHSAHRQQRSRNAVRLVAGRTTPRAGTGYASQRNAGRGLCERGALMKWGLVCFLAIATAVLVAFAWLQSGGLKQHAMLSAATPEEAVQALMSEIQAHNYQQAYASLDHSSEIGRA